MEEHTTIKACFFMLACVVSGGILADNHPIKDMVFHWAPIPHVVSKGPLLSVNRRVTDIMAVMTLITALASLLGTCMYLEWARCRRLSKGWGWGPTGWLGWLRRWPRSISILSINPSLTSTHAFTHTQTPHSQARACNGRIRVH